MDCIILAGGTVDESSPFFEYTGGKPKALLPINGRAMIEHVLEAMQNASCVEDIVIVGLDSDHPPSLKENVHLLPDQGGFVPNGLAGFRYLREYRQADNHVILCTADIPLISGKLVDDVVEACQPLSAALYYHFVTKKVMEQRFPHSNRTFVKLKGAEIAGADLLIVDTRLSVGRDALWEAVTNGRKHAWKLAGLVGPRFLLKFLLRRVGLREIEETASRILEMPVKIILTPHAEIGMDVDKPAHLDIIQAHVK